MELVLLIVFRNNNLDDYGNLRMITRTSEWETVLCSYNDYARKADHGGGAVLPIIHVLYVWSIFV